MPDPNATPRKMSVQEGEFIFEQWTKYLTLNVLDNDILNDFRSPSKIVSNVTAEKLRCVFSLGYRFAMLQVMQSSKKIYNITEDGKFDQEEFEQIVKMVQSQQEFINEKIEDSFMLNRTEGGDGMSLSRKLKNEFQEHLGRDVLSW